VGAQNNNEQVVKTLIKLSTVSVDAADKVSGDYCCFLCSVLWGCVVVSVRHGSSDTPFGSRYV
jgi:hypothetical protein